MKYILDKNVLTNTLRENIHKRHDLCVTQDVLEEAGFTKQEITKIKKSGVHILKVLGKHLEKLTEVLATHGGNFKLINLYLGEGSADVIMISYILAEQENNLCLFPEEYTLVTKDLELTSVAASYNINCIQEVV